MGVVASLLSALLLASATSAIAVGLDIEGAANAGDADKLKVSTAATACLARDCLHDLSLSKRCNSSKASSAARRHT